MVSSVATQPMHRLARLETGAVPPALVEYPVKPINSAERGYHSWATLAASRGTLPFTFPNWVATYLTHIEPGQRTQILLGTTSNGIVSALPLIRDRGRMCGLPVRRLRPPAAIAVPDRFDLTVAAGYADGAADGLLTHLQSRRDWDVLELVDLPDDGPGARLAMLAGQAGFSVGMRQSRATPYISLDGNLDRPGDTGSKFLANLRRRRRNLEKLGEVRLVRTENNDPDRFMRFLELEHSGWKGRNGTSILSNRADTDYHREIARLAAESGHLALYSLELNGEPIAMHFGLMIGNRYSVPKLAFAEHMHEYAPGHLLVWDILRDLTARGAREFDFLGNQMPWKREWTQRCRIQHRVHIFNRTLAGQAAYRLRYGVAPLARDAWLAAGARRRSLVTSGGSK